MKGARFSVFAPSQHSAIATGTKLRILRIDCFCLDLPTERAGPIASIPHQQMRHGIVGMQY